MAPDRTPTVLCSTEGGAVGGPVIPNTTYVFVFPVSFFFLFFVLSSFSFLSMILIAQLLSHHRSTLPSCGCADALGLKSLGQTSRRLDLILDSFVCLLHGTPSKLGEPEKRGQTREHANRENSEHCGAHQVTTECCGQRGPLFQKLGACMRRTGHKRAHWSISQ